MVQSTTRLQLTLRHKLKLELQQKSLWEANVTMYCASTTPWEKNMSKSFWRYTNCLLAMHIHFSLTNNLYIEIFASTRKDTPTCVNFYWPLLLHNLSGFEHKTHFLDTSLLSMSMTSCQILIQQFSFIYRLWRLITLDPSEIPDVWLFDLWSSRVGFQVYILPCHSWNRHLNS